MLTGNVGFGLLGVALLTGGLQGCEEAHAKRDCEEPWAGHSQLPAGNWWDWEYCGPSKNWGLIAKDESAPRWVTHPPREFASSLLGEGLRTCLREFDKGAAMCTTTLVDRGCAELRVFASGNVQYDIPEVVECPAERAGTLACSGPAPYEPKRIRLPER